MICSGVDCMTGSPIEVEFAEVITSIRALEPGSLPPSSRSLFIAPGFIDLQVNGFAGVDFNDPAASLADIQRALKAITATGVTKCLPTVITGPPDAMLASLRNLQQARTSGIPGAGIIPGFHVEGPHIGPEDGPRGAHPVQWVRAPDIGEFSRWQDATEGGVRLVTLSPHWPGAPGYISRVVAEGVAVAVGHTAASSDQIRAAVDAGATLSTHLGNAAPRSLRKFPNLLWDQLAEDRLNASFIVDGIHLDTAFLKAAVRAKSPARSVLVTDAAAPAGAVPGNYRLGELEVELTADDRVVLRGTTKLAGSALRMNRAISNVMRLADIDLARAVGMATVNPAKILKLKGHTAGLEQGERGDLTVFRLSPEIEIEAVYLKGARVK